MRSTSTFTISLPPAIARALEKLRKSEHRTRSELIREALRFYLLPSAGPSRRELRGIERGRAEIRRGRYLTLAQLHAELDRLNLLERSKGRAPRASNRARATRSRARPAGGRPVRRWHLSAFVDSRMLRN